MKQKLISSLFFFSLLALSLTFTSCKDDDSEQLPDNGSTVEGLETNEETILRHLIRRWADANELQTGWQGKTYEATEGNAYDEKNTTVRSVCVRTLEGADEYAIDVLSPLGIDFEHPDGFTYNDTTVGSVAYKHTPDGGNVLATIDVNIKQMPGLRRLELIKEPPVNAGGTRYYSMGDIIKYKNAYYLCVSDHIYGEKSRWITFDGEHTKGTCNWMFTGRDSVYNDDMASAATVADWVVNFLLNDDNWNNAVAHWIRKLPGTKCTIVPATNSLRNELVKALMEDAKWITNAYEPSPHDNIYRVSGYYWDDWEGHDNRSIYAPVGWLLCDKMRWTNGGSYWVPYVRIVTNKEYFKYYYFQCETPSQYTLSPSHFKWANLRKEVKVTSLQIPGFEETKLVSVCTAAFYWTHKTISIMDQTIYPLLDFTKDWKNKPDYKVDDKDSWCSRNITSRELTFTDKGNALSGSEPIYIKLQQH